MISFQIHHPTRSISTVYHAWASVIMFSWPLLTHCYYRFRMKGVTVLPEVGWIQVHLATQNKARHYQMVADLRDHRYE